MPAVSVIMPVLDGARYIGSAIESVLGQSFRDWELIVIDDGSADRTPDIVRSYTSDVQLRSIRQENRGLAAARNRGLSEAAAALVAFLDADDLWLEEHLEAMVARMEEAPAAVLAFAGWQYVDEHGDLLPQVVIPFDGDPARARSELPWRNSVLPSAVLARTDAVRGVGGFDATLPACEDWDLWIRLLAEGPFVASPKVSTLYRAHAESMTENGHAIERERLRVNEKHHG